MMTLGEWRPKKNKALVAEARKAWREAHAAKGGHLWMKHVKGHSADRPVRRGQRVRLGMRPHATHR